MNNLQLDRLNFPSYEMRLQKRNDGPFIFDPVRKKYIKLTPEEWVRQHVIKDLNERLDYPLTLMEVEKEFDLGKLKRRTDILCSIEANQPILMVECKRPEEKISQKVFDQISRYNIAFSVPYLMVTNGIHHIYAFLDLKSREVRFIRELPPFGQLNSDN